jgi:hypothetical protein
MRPKGSERIEDVVAAAVASRLWLEMVAGSSRVEERTHCRTAGSVGRARGQQRKRPAACAAVVAAAFAAAAADDAVVVRHLRSLLVQAESSAAVSEEGMDPGRSGVGRLIRG